MIDHGKRQVQIPTTMPIGCLSLKLADELPILFYANLLEEKALNLLNCPNAIVQSPTTSGDQEGNSYLVAGSKKPYKVKVGNGRLFCDCSSFR